MEEEEEEVEEQLATSSMDATRATSVSSSTLATTTLPTKKRVRFHPTLEVRTYSIVLGDHPMCPVLPISLGWEYEPEPALVDMDTHEEYSSWVCSSSTHTNSSSSSWKRLHRLSYLERKFLLRHVAGCSEQDLLDQEYPPHELLQYQQGFFLAHARPTYAQHLDQIMMVHEEPPQQQM
jgi:hypothetical protein